MKFHPLTSDAFSLLRLQTTPDVPRGLRTGSNYVVTDWFKGGTFVPSNEWARFAYDAEGTIGIHSDYFQVARIHYAHGENAWRWMSHPSYGSRYGLSSSEISPSVDPVEAKRIADIYLDYFSIYPKEQHNICGGVDIKEPHSVTLEHPRRPWRLLSWYKSAVSSETFYSRLWVLSPSAVAELPARERTGLLVQRVPACVLKGMGAMIRQRPDKRSGKRSGKCSDEFHWEVSVPPDIEKGESTSLNDAFHQADRTLQFLGCSVDRKESFRGKSPRG